MRQAGAGDAAASVERATRSRPLRTRPERPLPAGRVRPGEALEASKCAITWPRNSRPQHTEPPQQPPAAEPLSPARAAAPRACHTPALLRRTHASAQFPITPKYAPKSKCTRVAVALVPP